MPKFSSLLDNMIGKTTKGSEAEKLLKAFTDTILQINSQKNSIKKDQKEIESLERQQRLEREQFSKENIKKLKDFYDNIDKTNDTLEKLNTDLLKNENDLRFKGFTKDKLSELESQARRGGTEEDINRERNEILKQNSIGYKFVNGMLKKVGLSLEDFSSSMIEIDAVLFETIKQFYNLNEILSKFTRSTGGAISSFMIGFDRYGNNISARNTGSLNALAARYNFSKEDFFASLSGFGAGQVIGMQNNLSDKNALQRFGIEQARIIRLYDVSSESIATLSQNMTQLYGMSIKELNADLIQGKDIAFNAGVSVKKFFQNLAELSNMIGEYYIRDGAQGMQDLAEFATKLNVSVSSLFEGQKRLNTIQDLFQRQNQMVALGLTAYASDVAQIFAMQKLGDVKGANRAKFGSLASDILSMGYADRFGNINQQGLETLHAAGFTKDEINGVLRLLHENKQLNVSLAELSGNVKMTAADFAKVHAFEMQNATLGEKLKNLWDELKSLIIDPLASILSPLTDILINGLSIAFKALYISLQPIIMVFQGIGWLLTKVSEAFGKLGGLIDFKFNNAKSPLQKLSNGFDVLTAALRGFIPVFLTYLIWKKKEMLMEFFGGALSSLKSVPKMISHGFKAIGSRIGGIFRLGRVENELAGAEVAGAVGTVTSGAGVVGREGGLFRMFKDLGGAKVFGLSALAGVAGGLMENSSNKYVSIGGSALSMAGTGAAIGSLFGPGYGTVIGGAVGLIAGGIMGFIQQQKESNELLGQISDNTLKSSDQFKFVSAAPAFAGAQMASNIINSNVKSNQEKAIKAQEDIMKKQVAIQNPNITVINNTHLLGSGYVKARLTRK